MAFIVIVEFSVCVGKGWGRALCRHSFLDLSGGVMELSWLCLCCFQSAESFQHQSVPLVLPIFL